MLKGFSSILVLFSLLCAAVAIGSDDSDEEKNPLKMCFLMNLATQIENEDFVFEAGTLCDMSFPPGNTFDLVEGLMVHHSSWRNVWKDEVVSNQGITQTGKEFISNSIVELNYGNKNVTWDGQEIGRSVDIRFGWLPKSLEITPRQQMEFLSKLIRSKLPVSEYAQDKIRNSHKLTRYWGVSREWTNPDGWEIHPLCGELKMPTKSFCWCLGWIKRDQLSLPFVFLLQHDDANQEVGVILTFNTVSWLLGKLLESGDIIEVGYIASMRKSIFEMLWGKYVDEGLDCPRGNDPCLHPEPSI